MKRLTVQLLIIISLVSVSCNSSNYSNYSKEELEKRLQELTVEKSHAIAKGLIEYYIENDKTPPIFVWDDINSYLESDEVVMSHRKMFTDASDSLEGFEMTIDRWRALMDTVKSRNNGWDGDLSNTRNEILDSLRKSEGPYNELIKSIQECLKVGNTKILSYIVNDYIGQGKEIPFDWIDDDIFEILISQPKVLKIEDKIRRVKKTISER